MLSHIEGMEDENLHPIEEISSAEAMAEVLANSQEIQNEVG